MSRLCLLARVAAQSRIAGPSTGRFIHALAPVSEQSMQELEDEETKRRKRKTDWKRQQRGQTFLDHLIVNVRAGRGGDGCVAFHREKFMPYGPPSGGNGGRGADVFIVPTPHLTTLSSVKKQIRGQAGGHGQGTWMNGRNAPPTVIRVPIGTVVRELAPDDPRCASNEYEAEEEDLRGLSLAERVQRMRKRRWVHYPEAEDDNLQRDAFKEAEKVYYRQERDRRLDRRQQKTAPLVLDLDYDISHHFTDETFSKLDKGGTPRGPPGHLLATGGAGGIGNPAFLTTDNRSPKFATRGADGQRITLSLELKLLADVGLVGFPNAGKSTLLRALTGGRARTEVADYEFTTLNPVVGVVRVDDDGGLLEGGDEGGRVIEDTKVEERRFAESMERGEFANAPTRNQQPAASPLGEEHTPMHARPEAFRFTIADNPGLISQASENVGLGHSFLRSIERSLALAYVVDLSGPAPADELRILRDELEKYKPGLSAKARVVIANKADLLDGGGDPAEVALAREKLARLEAFVRTEMRGVHVVPPRGTDGATTLKTGGEVVIEVGKVVDVVPVSAKFSQNLRKVISLLRSYIEEARSLGPSRL